MQRSLDVIEPTVIDEQLIKDCIHITAFDRPGGGGEASAAEKKAEIDLEDVRLSMFRFHSPFFVASFVYFDSTR